MLAVGDAEFQKKCLGKMEDVSKSGRTILFVSHNMGAIKQLCTKCILLRNGSIDFVGEAQDATSRYLNPGKEKITIQRPPQAPLWIEDVSINGNNMNPIIYYGQNIVIIVTCSSVVAGHVYLGFVISTMDGSAVLNANNRYQKNDLILEAATPTRITCDLGSVPLMEGQYTLNLYLGDESKDYHIIENALQIEVYERDIWGNGSSPPKRVSKIWWDTTFSISQKLMRLLIRYTFMKR